MYVFIIVQHGIGIYIEFQWFYWVCLTWCKILWVCFSGITMYSVWGPCGDSVPERSCLIRPLLLLISTGRKSLNQEISGSGLPLAAHSMVAVLVFSTTFSWGPMSMLGNPCGIWFSVEQTGRYGISMNDGIQWHLSKPVERTFIFPPQNVITWEYK